MAVQPDKNASNCLKAGGEPTYFAPAAAFRKYRIRTFCVVISLHLLRPTSHIACKSAIRKLLLRSSTILTILKLQLEFPYIPTWPPEIYSFLRPPNGRPSGYSTFKTVHIEYILIRKCAVFRTKYGMRLVRNLFHFGTRVASAFLFKRINSRPRGNIRSAGRPAGHSKRLPL